MRCIKPVRVYRVVGLGLMFSLLGCGGKAEDDSPRPGPSYSAPRATPTAPPSVSVPPSPPARATQPEPMQKPAAPTEAPGRYPLPGIDLGPAAAENVLSANCAQCHGPALTQAQAQAGINFITDLDQLAAAGWIVPLSSDTSPIIIEMRNGSMPPPASGLPRVTEADIDVVASHIDNPRFWLDWSAPAVVDAGVERPTVDAGADGG
jgi:mono/diheme cytochrome c family protein